MHGPSLITDHEIPSTIPGRAIIDHRPIGVLLGVMPAPFVDLAQAAVAPLLR